MKLMKVERFGTKAQGVKFRGKKENPEPASFRITIPGGEVEVNRVDLLEGVEYWVHVYVHKPNDGGSTSDGGRAVIGEVCGEIVDARLDIRGAHSANVDVGDFDHPDLYHLAVRVAPI